MKASPAGFLVRLLAQLLDGAIFMLPHALLLSYISQSQNLSELTGGIFIEIMLLLGSFAVILIYSIMLTHYFGGSIGKLATGLTVKDESNAPLNFKRILFRQTIGYMFSWLVLGLGYLAIIKDENKQGWHDKAVGSKVLVKQNLWPLGLVLLIALYATNGYLATNSLKRLINGPIKPQIQTLVTDLAAIQKAKEASASATLKAPQQSPAPTLNLASPAPKVNSTNPNTPTYTQADIDSWKKDIDYYDGILDFYNKKPAGFDQTKVDQLVAKTNQLRAIAANLYRKMLAKQSLTPKDFADIQNYNNILYPAQQTLMKDLQGQ